MDKKFSKIKVLAVVECNSKVLLLRGVAETWQLPGGKLEYGEDPRVGMERELKEELGVSTFSLGEIIDAKSRLTDIGEEYQVVFIIYSCVMLDEYFILSDEHTEGKWFLKEEIQDLPMWEIYREVILENLN
jgi:8-oxo-dGTP diphosphatase